MYVVKIGGRSGNDAGNVVADVKAVRPCVLVHGGSSAADELAAAMGRPPRFVTTPSGFTSRYTDAFAIDVVAMAMAGRLNVHLVAALQAQGVPALGLSGVDGGLVTGRRKEVLRVKEDGKVKVIRDDRSGTVEGVNADLLRAVLDAGYVPVVSPPILDAVENVPLNADADRIAAQIAGALRADALVLLTNVEGVFLGPRDGSTLLSFISRAELPARMEGVSGGMKKKLLACQEALAAGVPRAVIGDSRRPEPIRAALRGEGTVIA